MPWTRKQVRYLLSDVSPLSGSQKSKMKAELHDDPSLGHHTKGSSAMQKHNIREMRIEVHRGKGGEVTGHTVHHHMMPKAASKSAAFLEETHHSFPFDAKGMSSTHGSMKDHIAKHLALNVPGKPRDGEAAASQAEDNEGGGEEMGED